MNNQNTANHTLQKLHTHETIYQFIHTNIGSADLITEIRQTIQSLPQPDNHDYQTLINLLSDLSTWPLAWIEAHMYFLVRYQGLLFPLQLFQIRQGPQPYSLLIQIPHDTETTGQIVPPTQTEAETLLSSVTQDMQVGEQQIILEPLKKQDRESSVETDVDPNAETDEELVYGDEEVQEEPDLLKEVGLQRNLRTRY